MKRHAHALIAGSCLVLLVSIAPQARALGDDPPAPAPAGPQPSPPASPAPDPVPVPVQPAKPADPTPEQPVIIRPAPGEDREITLYLKDGRRVRGDLVEKNAGQFIVKVAGINTTYAVDEVERFTLLPSLLERYREIRRTINENDVDQMLKVVAWLEEKGQLDLALAELVGLRKRQPENQTVIRELGRIQRLIDLKDKPGAKPQPKLQPDAPAPAVNPANRLAADSVTRLTPEQINLIKVYEVDLMRPPQIIVPRDVMLAAFEKYAGNPLVPASREGRDAVVRQSGERKLDLLFRLKARELYPRVQIVDNPEAIRAFRQDVFQSFLLNSCATAQCHGGTEAGRLMFATRQPNSDATVYTNFHIADRFRLTSGEPLINCDKPELSPMLQMALPREDAVIRHPPVIGGDLKKDQWRPVFRNTQERRYLDTVAWIKSLYKPRPDYDLGYTPVRPFTAPEPVVDPAPSR